MQVAGVEVLVEGRGSRSIVMIHGWPDTHRLWDPQVALFGERYRCVRFTLPGFDDRRTPSLDELVETIRRVVEETCPGERVTLLVHDWGCVFGYQFALRHAQLRGVAGALAHEALLTRELVVGDGPFHAASLYGVGCSR